MRRQEKVKGRREKAKKRRAEGGDVWKLGRYENTKIDFTLTTHLKKRKKANQPKQRGREAYKKSQRTTSLSNRTRETSREGGGLRK